MALDRTDPPRPSPENDDHVKGEAPMKLSARNLLKGQVVEVKKGAVAAQVRVDVGGGNVLTSMITVDAVEDLGLRQGDQVSVVIKSTEVMLAV
jgi:molybdopterin-binding protein